MIPKIIHYCWFGNNPLPEKVLKCIESWRKFCPDYEIMRWDETNYDFNKNTYISQAYKEKKWAFVADYARLDVVYQYGGVYLDTDVELIANIDNLLSERVFMSIEKYSRVVNTGLGFGAEKNIKEIKELMNIYDSISFVKADGTLDLTPCTKYTTDYLAKKGYRYQDVTQKIGYIKIFASEFFCPINFETGKISITDNTIGIHWYDATWFSADDKAIHQIEQKIKRNFPTSIAVVACWIFRKTYRFFQYIKEGTLIVKIKKKITR